MESGTGWLLPSFSCQEQRNWFEVDFINQTIFDLIGAEVTVLRCIEGDDNTSEPLTRVYELENHSSNWKKPDNAKWIDKNDAAQVNFSDPEHGSTVLSWFRETNKNLMPRNSWQSRGWADNVMKFVSDSLAKHGASSMLSYSQLRTWDRSCVFRFVTHERSYILKASPPIFSHEPRMAMLLSERYPDQFPRVIAVCDEDPVLLMEEVKFPLLLGSSDLLGWKTSLRQIAKIQKDLIRERNSIPKTGCPDLGLAWMASLIEPLLLDTDSMLVNEINGLRPEEVRELIGLVPYLSQMCSELDGIGIPETFEHGDFRPSNIFYFENRCMFIDLSNCAVSHPFFTAVTLIDFEQITANVPINVDVKGLLRDEYLRLWGDYGSEKKLIYAYELARPLAILHAALVRKFIVLPEFAKQSKWNFMVPYWLKRIAPSVHGFRAKYRV